MNIFYKNKFVNDLAWVISSNSLIQSKTYKNNYNSEECQKLYLSHKSWLKDIDDNFHLYKDEIIIKNHLLGKYFEQLLSFFFKHSPYYELIVQNQQIIINKVTKGEVDFVVFNKQLKQYEHIEVAIKYYMHTNKHQESNWVGPNSNDYYEKKLTNLFSHQLKILENYKSNLPQLNNINQIVSRVWIKGYLLNKKLNHNFIYLQESDLDQYFKLIDSYYEIQKLDWIEPTFYHPNKFTYNYKLIEFKKSIKERFLLNPKRPISFNAIIKPNHLQTVILLNDAWPID